MHILWHDDNVYMYNARFVSQNQLPSGSNSPETNIMF